jgi:hypothetical protein
MIKNRTFQLMFQTAFCTLGFLGIIASFGTFNYAWRGDFYVHFTNLSNYLCIGVVLAELIQTVKKKEDSYVDKLPVLKFIGVLAILLTFIVFNFILAGDREMYLNFQINSVLFHIILPILYVLDWFLFYERGKVKIIYPVCSTIFPIVYVVFIFIRAWILNFDSTVPYIYPYFFLNLDKLGVFGVTKWVVLLSLGFIVVGFLFYGIDKILSKNKKNKLK